MRGAFGLQALDWTLSTGKTTAMMVRREVPGDREGVAAVHQAAFARLDGGHVPEVRWSTICVTTAISFLRCPSSP